MALKYELRRVINEIAELVRKIYTVDTESSVESLEEISAPYLYGIEK